MCGDCGPPQIDHLGCTFSVVSHQKKSNFDMFLLFLYLDNPHFVVITKLHKITKFLGSQPWCNSMLQIFKGHPSPRNLCSVFFGWCHSSWLLFRKDGCLHRWWKPIGVFFGPRSLRRVSSVFGRWNLVRRWENRCEDWWYLSKNAGLLRESQGICPDLWSFRFRTLLQFDSTCEKPAQVDRVLPFLP